MNTVAIYDNYRDFILLWLKLGRLKHAYWFIHEDIAQLPIIHKEFLETGNLAQIKNLVNQDSLSVLFPSQRTTEEYRELLGIANAKAINLHVEVDEKYLRPKVIQDFSTIDFLLSGTAGDGRKGQFLAISAFHLFMEQYYNKNPDNYRDFKLHLVAIGDDYVSSQIKWTATSLLEKRVKIYKPLPKDEALAITAVCDAVICCSLNETFGLYIAEGMLMGHIVLRNNSAGMVEQLIDGQNGYFIDHTDIHQFASAIEKLLNVRTNTDKELLKMSLKSQEIIKEYGRYTYISQIE
jgi:glycosyltransferase involved in cell wall biosynthesis